MTYKKYKVIAFTVSFLTVLATGNVSAEPGPKQSLGAVLGAAVGGAVGSQVGDRDHDKRRNVSRKHDKRRNYSRNPDKRKRNHARNDHRRNDRKHLNDQRHRVKKHKKPVYHGRTHLNRQHYNRQHYNRHHYKPNYHNRNYYSRNYYNRNYYRPKSYSRHYYNRNYYRPKSYSRHYYNRNYYSRNYYYGNGSSQLVATAMGVFIGALIGSEIGRYMDDVDRLSASQANVQAQSAPVGTRITWNNPSSTNYGSITPTREGYSESGRYCREFYQTVSIGNRTEEAYGTACRQPDGAWKIVQSLP
jgi:surface antigen